MYKEHYHRNFLFLFIFTVLCLMFESAIANSNDDVYTRTLSEDGKEVYSFLKNCISKVAEGEETSTVFQIDGVYSIDNETDALLTSLSSSCPFELYWFDKIKGMHIFEDNGWTYFLFSVKNEYANGDYEVNSEAIHTVVDSMASAMSIIEKYADASDIDKLAGYVNEISKLVDYNYDARDHNDDYDRNAWELIWVFDGDESTDVVCEGYAKAFQYLCDHTVFSDTDIYCYPVTGTLNCESHMWNLVHMSDDTIYMVDVTACDSNQYDNDIADSSESPFLAGYFSGDTLNGYNFRFRFISATADYYQDQYCYDARTLACYPEAMLSVSNHHYHTYVGNYTQDGIVYYLSVDEAIVIGYTEVPSILTIPGTVQGIPVTRISEDAFSDCISITEVEFPDSLQVIEGSYIIRVISDADVLNEYEELVHTEGGPQILYNIDGKGAFSGCTNLSAVHFGNNSQLKKINPFAFAFTSITEIELPETVTQIGAGAFYWCPSLTTVYLNDNLRTIGKCAFSIGHSGKEINYPLGNTSSLRNIRFGSKVEYIDACAFGNASLTNVSLPESLQYIGDFAFHDTGLSQVQIPSSVEYIGIGAFLAPYISSIEVSASNTHYSSLDGVLFSKDKTELICCPRQKTGSYQVPDSVVKIRTYAFFGTVITSCVLPESIKELGVLCFYGSYISSINLPSGMSVIPEAAFLSCSLSGDLIIPDSVTKIGDSAFANNIHLESVSFGQGLREIGAYAFQNTTLRSLMLPNSVESIGIYAFAGTSVTDVQIPMYLFGSLDLNAIFYDTPYLGKTGQCGDHVSYSINGDTLVVYGQGLMWDYWGWNSPFNNQYYVTKLVIEEGVTYVGNATFVNMDGLTEITFPHNILAVGDELIQSCPILEKVTFLNPKCIIPSGALPSWLVICGYDDSTAYEYAQVTGNGFESLGEYVGNDTDIEAITGQLNSSSILWEYQDYTLTITGEGSILVNDGEVSGSDYPWYELKAFIRNINIANGITSIGAYAFDHFSQLTAVQLPESLYSIGNNAFYYCVRLTGIVLPEQLESIGDNAFSHCEAIKSVQIPDTVHNLGNSVFLGCYQLENFELPLGITEIGEGMFGSCYNLYKIDLPDSIIHIGNGAFGNCYNLSSIHLPSSLDKISWSAFGETNISEIDIPETVTSIERYAFSRCKNLIRISLPENLFSVCYGAFYECTQLHTVIIPEKVQNIEAEAFLGCTHLENIVVLGSDTVIENHSLGFIPEIIDGNPVGYHLTKNVKMFCRPNSSAMQYALANGIPCITSNSSRFVIGINLADHETDGEIDYLVYSSTGCMTSESEIIDHNTILYLPSLMTIIDEEAFSNIAAQEIIIPSGCISIRNKAFADCGELLAVVIPASVSDIASDAFDNCSNIMIACIKDSYAYQFVINHGLPYHIIEP